MPEYSVKPLGSIKTENREIFLFESYGSNIHSTTVKSFGEEWDKFHAFSEQEINAVGEEYFDIVTAEQLNKNSVVLDVGCGSGRWTKYVAGKAKFVEAVDPSDAVLAADRLLRNIPNVRISKASTENIPFPDGSFDFVFSLGVLHHIPDTKSAMMNCIAKLKKDGCFLVYLYYNFDNRGFIFKTIFSVSNIFRIIISSLPAFPKKIVCDLVAVFVYMPLLWLTDFLLLLRLNKLAKKIPLFYYHNKTFHIIRNDALDRFGTPLEHRFSKNEIRQMMENCGLGEIKFSDSAPYWHAVGKKK